MASLVRKATSKFFFAAFRDINGRQKRRSTFETDRKKAQRIADEWERIAKRLTKQDSIRESTAQLIREIYGEDVSAATVAQFVTEWLISKKHETAPATYASYKKSTDKFLSFLGDASERDIAEVTRKQVLEFRNDISKKVAPGTVNADLKCLKMLFRAAKRDGYISQDPSEFVETVRDARRGKRKPFAIPEVKNLLEAADEEWRSLILFGLYTGQRLADIAALTWENVDLVREEIRLTTRKTGKHVTIPIAAPLKEHLLIISDEDDPTAPIHPKAYDLVEKQGRSGNLSNQFGDLLAQAGLAEKKTHSRKKKGRDARRAHSELSFHSLRHTAVTLLKDAGIPEAVVMELVGHDSKQMSRHYTHVGIEALRKAADALPRL